MENRKKYFSGQKPANSNHKVGAKHQKTKVTIVNPTGEPMDYTQGSDSELWLILGVYFLLTWTDKSGVYFFLLLNMKLHGVGLPAGSAPGEQRGPLPEEPPLSPRWRWWEWARMSGLSSERSSMWEMSRLEITDCTDCRDGRKEEWWSQDSQIIFYQRHKKQ